MCESTGALSPIQVLLCDLLTQPYDSAGIDHQLLLLMGQVEGLDEDEVLIGTDNRFQFRRHVDAG